MERQGRIVPANNRYRAGELQSALETSEEQDRSRHHSVHCGGLELSTGTGLYGACRSTQCCLAVLSRWVESSTRPGGFRALKKTTEAPDTTKVNYRDHTSRGTTPLLLAKQRPARGAGQPVRPPGTEHPPRAILAAHEVNHLSTTWSPVRATASSSSSSCPRGYQPRRSRPGWP